MSARAARVTVDFAQRVDHPLSKSTFAIFNSGLVHPATYQRDAEHLRAAKPEHCRIDIGWGAEWMNHPHPVTGTADIEDDTFQDLDAIAVALRQAGIRPYWSYCYVPEAFRPQDGTWRDLEDVTGWADMIRSYAAGATRRGVSVGYHEIYNEPDLRDERTGEAVFYSGNLADYLELYRVTAPILAEVDPDTPVGGPALALVHPDQHWIPAFLDMVLEHHLPLNFFSFHHYGTYTLGTAIEKVLGQLQARPELDEVAVHLNEYNSFPIDYPRGGLQDSYLIVGAMLADFARLLAIPGITVTSWAQFLDSGHDNYSGMIDIDGQPKPIFHAFRRYQDLPVDRYALSSDGVDGVGGMAAAENGRCCVVLWNRSTGDVAVELSLAALPFRPSDATITWIDADHAGDTSTPLELGSDSLWQLPVPRAAVVFLELTGDGAVPEVQPYGPVQRVHRRYPDRQASAWADLHEASTTFRLGTADAPGAVPVIGARIRSGAPVMVITTELTDDAGNVCDTGALTLRIESTHQAFVLDLGPSPAGQLALPSWTGKNVPTTVLAVTTSRPTTLDLPAHGMDADDVTVTLWLSGAQPGSFATVQLSPGNGAPS